MKIKVTTTIILLLVSFGAVADYESDLIESYSKLELGMSKETTQVIMGKPKQTRRMVTKKGEFIGYSYTYVIYKHKKNLVNLKYDKRIQLYFDVKGKLKWATSINIKGLKEIGTPAR